MSDSDVSIAMGTYNGARFIREQLHSFSAQTRRPLELIITDDGSTDDTLAIVCDFAKTAPFAVKINSNETQLGFRDNFLKAAALCSGSLIAFSDQDDVWLPRKLEMAVKALSGPNVKAFIHSASVVDEELKELGSRRPDYNRSRLAPFQPWGTFQGFAIVFKRELMDIPFQRRPASVHGHPRMAHDEWIHFLAELTGKVFLSRETLALYRQHGSNQYGAGDQKSRGIPASLSTGAAQYVRLCGLAEDRAQFLEALIGISDTPASAKGTLACGIGRYRRAAIALRRRSGLYEPEARRSTRLHRLFRMLTNRDYWSSDSSLTLPSLIKDVSYAVVGKRLRKPEAQA